MATDVQVAAWAADAGFSEQEIPKAVAIAIAESHDASGLVNESATNHNVNGSTDYGAWQINSVHADVLAQGQWSNGADNAKMAYAVFQQAGNSFRPWVTYNTGAYLKYMTRGNAALATIKGQLNSAIQKGQQNLTNPPPSALDNLTNADFWRRVAIATVGGIAILWALMKMTGDNQLSEGTKSLVKTAVKVAAK